MLRAPLLLSLPLLFALGCSDDTQTKSDGKPSTTDSSVVQGKACVATCTTGTDCPTASSGFTYTCSGGYCLQSWCTASADCKVSLFPDCVDSGFAKQCVPAACSGQCQSGNECRTIFPTYKGCVPTGTAVDCTTDTQCTPPDFSPGHTKCQQGYCGCESDAACQSAKTSAGLTGTWKCVPWSGTWKKL